MCLVAHQVKQPLETRLAVCLVSVPAFPHFWSSLVLMCWEAADGLKCLGSCHQSGRPECWSWLQHGLSVTVGAIWGMNQLWKIISLILHFKTLMLRLKKIVECSIRYFVEINVFFLFLKILLLLLFYDTVQ